MLLKPGEALIQWEEGEGETSKGEKKIKGCLKEEETNSDAAEIL